MSLASIACATGGTHTCLAHVLTPVLMLLCVASDVMDFEKPENVKKDDVVMEYKGECG